MLYVRCGASMHCVDVSPDATVADVADALPDRCGALSIAGVSLPKDIALSDAGVGQEAVLDAAMADARATSWSAPLPPGGAHHARGDPTGQWYYCGSVEGFRIHVGDDRQMYWDDHVLRESAAGGPKGFDPHWHAEWEDHEVWLRHDGVMHTMHHDKKTGRLSQRTASASIQGSPDSIVVEDNNSTVSSLTRVGWSSVLSCECGSPFFSVAWRCRPTDQYAHGARREEHRRSCIAGFAGIGIVAEGFPQHTYLSNMQPDEGWGVFWYTDGEVLMPGESGVRHRIQQPLNTHDIAEMRVDTNEGTVVLLCNGDVLLHTTMTHWVCPLHHQTSHCGRWRRSERAISGSPSSRIRRRPQPHHPSDLSHP